MLRAGRSPEWFDRELLSPDQITCGHDDPAMLYLAWLTPFDILIVLCASCASSIARKTGEHHAVPDLQDL